MKTSEYRHVGMARGLKLLKNRHMILERSLSRIIEDNYWEEKQNYHDFFLRLHI